MSDYVEVNLELTLEMLKQQLKQLIENNPILNCYDDNQMREWRNDLEYRLAIDTKKLQHKQDKNKKKRKKSKKQSQQQKLALQNLKEILISILFQNAKYQNVKKNLIKISNKIDSCEMLYSILNPIIQKYLIELLKEDIPSSSNIQQNSSQVMPWLEQIKLKLSQIQQCGSIGFVMQSLNLFEKVLIYLIYNKPKFMQIFVYWYHNAASICQKNASLVKMILAELPDLDQIQVVRKNQEEQEEMSGEAKQESNQSIKEDSVEEEDEKVEKLIHYIQNMTFKQDRIKVNLDPDWLQQFIKKHSNNINQNTKSNNFTK